MSAIHELSAIRPGEITGSLPDKSDAAVYFIGRIGTPWTNRLDCPKQGDAVAGPLCRIDVAEEWKDALAGIERAEKLQILYWMHHARRDLILQSPRSDGQTKGTFAIRSPNRPNPIASSIVSLVSVQGTTLVVRGLDCLDGTPVIDIKPEFCLHAS